MRAWALRLAETPLERAFGSILAADARDGDGRVALRKGTRLGEVHTPLLRTLAGAALHLVELDPGELDQDEVARLLGAVLAGPGIAAEEPQQGQVRLRATRRGLLRVDAESLRALNRLPPLLCFTQPDGLVLLEGDEVAGAKAAALATPASVVAEAEALLARAPALAVKAFAARRIGVVVTERLERRARALVMAAVQRKVEWFGSALLDMREAEHASGAVDGALRALLSSGADLVLVSGANALDPLDPVFVALRSVGGEVVRWGVPAHPGSMVWVGRIAERPVLGVATCAGFGKNTALDLVLARVLADEDLVRAVEDVGHGGLAEGERAAGRFPPYERES